MNRPALLALPALLLALAGCVSVNPDTVTYGETQRMSTVQDAVVLSVRPIVIDGTQTGAGAMTGGMVGSMAGASIGGYRDGFVGSILGAVAGAVVGNAMERGATTQNGTELTLQLRNGDKRMVIQGNGRESFQPGDAVVVVSNGHRARVSRAPANTPPVIAPQAPAQPPTANPDGRPAPIYTPR